MCPYAALVFQNDALHGRQTHSAAGEIGIIMQALKRCKQFVRILHIETYAVVAHEVDFFAVSLLHAQLLDSVSVKMIRASV